MRRSFDRLVLFFEFIWGENPRGHERKREYPVDIRAASGPQATGPGAKEEARKRSDAGGLAPYALILHIQEFCVKKKFLWTVTF